MHRIMLFNHGFDNLRELSRTEAILKIALSHKIELDQAETLLDNSNPANPVTIRTKQVIWLESTGE